MITILLDCKGRSYKLLGKLHFFLGSFEFESIGGETLAITNITNGGSSRLFVFCVFYDPICGISERRHLLAKNIVFCININIAFSVVISLFA
jgi:hypothetical protein